jgi:hypothetical protein
VVRQKANGRGHFFFKYNAWAIDEDILAELVKMGVEQVYLMVKGEGLLVTTIENFQEHSLLDEYGKHGLQAFLEENYWEAVQ